MSIIGATEQRREEYMAQMISWLACGNQSWIDDRGSVDIENGGGAMGVAMSVVHRIETKIAALPVEVIPPPLLEAA